MKVTNEQIDFIVKHDNLYNGEQLSKQLGLSRGTISRIRKENGLPSRVFRPNKDEFIRNYENYKSSRKLAEIYRVDKATILNFAKKIGYRNKYADERLLNEEQIQTVINSYDITTALKLAVNYNCSKERIQQIWAKNGKKGKANRTYYCNFDYFEEIDSPDKAYFIGFIAADGCVYSRNKENAQKWLKIAIHRKDRELLEQLSYYMNSDHPIRDYDVVGKNMTHQYSDITIVSDKICEDLSKYNIIERKTWRYVPNNIPEEYIFHYLRGFFDGDGSISVTNNSILSGYAVSYCGNKNTMSFIHAKLKEYNINSYLIEDTRESKYTDEFFNLVIHKASETYKFLTLIYKESENMRLSRKYKRGRSFIDLYKSKQM